MTLGLIDVLESLAGYRPVFHSEADFQHALAWAIHEQHPEFEVRLEVPFSSGSSVGYLDLLITDEDRSYPTEVKYKTRKLNARVDSEQYRLKSQAAQDLGRYDFFRDVQRIEKLCKANPTWRGWALFLTNDSSYWSKPGKPIVAYEDFRMDAGRQVSGTLKWGKTAGKGTTAGRQSPITITDSYKMVWRKYSSLELDGYSTFRYLAVPVGEGDQDPA